MSEYWMVLTNNMSVKDKTLIYHIASDYGATFRYIPWNAA